MALPSSTPLTCQHGRAIAPCHSLSQVNAVNNESKQSFNIAKAYLDKLMDLNKKHKDITQPTKDSKQIEHQQNIFVGSTADLQKMLQKESEEIDVTPTDE